MTDVLFAALWFSLGVTLGLTIVPDFRTLGHYTRAVCIAAVASVVLGMAYGLADGRPVTFAISAGCAWFVFRLVRDRPREDADEPNPLHPSP